VAGNSGASLATPLIIGADREATPTALEQRLFVLDWNAFGRPRSPSLD
jgi:hypothetical protein